MTARPAIRTAAVNIGLSALLSHLTLTDNPTIRYYCFANEETGAQKTCPSGWCQNWWIVPGFFCSGWELWVNLRLHIPLQGQQGGRKQKESLSASSAPEQPFPDSPSRCKVKSLQCNIVCWDSSSGGFSPYLYICASFESENHRGCLGPWGLVINHATHGSYEIVGIFIDY